MEDNDNKIVGIVQRPKLVSDPKNLGQVTKYVTNNFQIKYTGHQEIYVYIVAFNPSIPGDARELKKELVYKAFKSKEFTQKFGEKNSYFSGENLYSFKKIEEPLNVPVGEGVNQYVVLFQYSSSVKMTDLNPIANRTSNITTMILNIMIKQALQSLGMREMGRNKKYYNDKQLFDNKIEYNSKYPIYVWSGFKTSVGLGQSGQYLQIDFCSRLVKEKTLLDFIYDYKTDQEADENLKGKNVIADYGNHRNYRIEGIKIGSKVTDKFKTSDGKEISYVEYFQTKYKVKIKDLKQPLAIVLKNKNRPNEETIYLVPELLLTTGISDEERNDFKLMQAMANYTKKTPQQRQEIVQNLSKDLQKQTGNKFEIVSNSNSVEGIELYTPKITIGNKSQQVSSGNFQLRDNIQSPIEIKDWVIIYYSNGSRDDDDVDRILEDFQKVGQGFGIKIGKPGFLTVKSDRDSRPWIDALKKDIDKNGKPQLVLSITFKKNKTIYEDIKNFLCCEEGVISQHMQLSGGIQKNRLSVITKIVLQINAKMGKPLWLIERPPKLPEQTMLIGIEFSRFIEKGKPKTVIGIVATLSSDFTNLWSKAVVILDGQQGHNILNSIQTVTQKAINAYQKANSKLPTHIILYRESAGDSASELIARQEIQGIKLGFQQISSSYNPEFAYIIFKKKINSRFFQQEKGLQNPNPGSLIYKDVSGQHFNFFLIPQKVTQGCATPTEFVVCYNSTSLPQETFFLLTYYQCYNYFNWFGAVRVPGVAQYANKLARMVGDCVRKEFHPNLSQGPVFL